MAKLLKYNVGGNSGKPVINVTHYCQRIRRWSDTAKTRRSSWECIPLPTFLQN